MSGLMAYLEEFNLVSITLRLVLATLMGGIIGAERASKRHAAGLRTFALVCLGAALATIVNLYLWQATGGTADSSRIPAGVVSGVGFLGVGTIVVTSRNHVKGLTTAAGLWATAALGLALGAGMIYVSVIAFVLLVVVIFLLQHVSHHREQYSRFMGVYLEVEKDKGISQLLQHIQEKGYEISSMEKRREKIVKGYDVVVQLELDLKGKNNHSDILSELSNIEGVNYLEEIRG